MGCTELCKPCKSVLDKACREVGLEDLFKTSMNTSDSDRKPSASKKAGNESYGTLVRVDHMNNGRNYRKWLRRNAEELGLSLMIKQGYPNDDVRKRPFIFVGLVGRKEDVENFLKRWRAIKVDVDSRGKPCLERMMIILHEGYLEESVSSGYNPELTHSEENVVQSLEKILELSSMIGGTSWREAMMHSLQ